MNGAEGMVAVCACGCKKPIEQARREARARPGWLNPDQAAAGVPVAYVPESEAAR